MKTVTASSSVTNEADKRNRTLILIRWFASFSLLLVSLLIYYLQLDFEWFPLVIISLVVAIYNLAFYLLSNRISKVSRIFIHQIIFDWIALFFVCYFTGAISSPAVYLFPIYSSLAGFETTQNSKIILPLLSSILVTLLGLVHIYNHQDVKHIVWLTVGQVVFIIAVNIVMGIIGKNASDEMKRRLKTVSDLRDDLTLENRRLQSVYDLTLEMNSTLETSDVQSAITNTVTKIKPIMVAVIRMLSEDGKAITIMNVAGLKSEPDMGSVELSKDLIDYEAITTLEPVYVPDVNDDPRFLYREEALREGLVSLLAVPMIHYGKPLGVLRCYTSQFYDFRKNEVEFLKLVASESSLSITNALNYKKMQELDKSRTSFIRFATHELRAPMAAIQSILQLVLDGYTGDVNPQQKKFFERANARIEQLLTLVRELLELEGTANTVLEFGEHNIRDIIVSVINELSPKADSKHIKLRLNVYKNPIDICCNKDSLHRAFENLVDNAIKYTPLGGKVDVSISEHEEDITVGISDTGIGIPKDQIPRLFSEFFRATNAKEQEVDGTGLGLSIVKKIIDSHKGEISISSVENIGTTFSVTLPKIRE